MFNKSLANKVVCHTALDEAREDKFVKFNTMIIGCNLRN